MFKFHGLLSLLVPYHTVLVSVFPPSRRKHLLICDHSDVDIDLPECCKYTAYSL